MTARRSQTLDGGWTVTAHGEGVPAHLAGRPVPARAPGSGHTALLDAGLAPDPYLGDEESRWTWAHRASWTFERGLPPLEQPLGPDERVDLVFEGLQTLAVAQVDDAAPVRSSNMHRTVRMPVGAGRRVRVGFGSALAYAEAERDRLGARPAAYPHPYYLVRSMACAFGWDWGPDLQAAGLWRPVRLERWRTARLAAVQPIVRRRDGSTWEVEVRIEVERAGDAAIEAEVAVDGAGVRTSATSAVTGDLATVRLEVRSPQLWHPHDRGEQPLADLRVALRSGTEVLDVVEQRIGFRTVVLRQEPDEHGTSFELMVNGEPVFVRGVNWIPADHLVDRVRPGRVRALLTAARDAHANLVRVWGGGVYESDEFYGLCDELGLLVWQDVAMACAGYPESEPLRNEILAEVRENAVRLAPHPSLALWCGGNENAWGEPQWVARGDLAEGVDWGERYIDEWLPQLLAEVDPARPYIPNSPFSPPADDDGSARWPNDPAHGAFHEWDVWNRDDWTAYRRTTPRFCAEFGYQAPPRWSLVRDTMTADGALDTTAPAFMQHQKADDGAGKLARGMAPHLGAPADPDAWHAATQAAQALALRTAIEHYRAAWPVTTGAIVWQLNDCWPAVSWSLLDVDGHAKPAYWAVRRAFADRIVTLEPWDGGWRATLVNDAADPWAADLVLRRETLDGAVVARATMPVEAGARSAAPVDVPAVVLEGRRPTEELLVAEVGGVPTIALLAEPIGVAWRPDPVEASAERIDGGWRVRMRARSAVVGLGLAVDRLDPDARVDDGMIDLPAGGEAVLHVRGAAGADPAALLSWPVLQHLGAVLGA
jgi:beta-mannosidase